LFKRSARMRWTSNARITIDVGSDVKREGGGKNESVVDGCFCLGKSFKPFVREDCFGVYDVV
jgi:hypothetical protein